MATMEDLHKLIQAVYEADKQQDEETLFDMSADVMSVYLEALSDVHFGGQKTEWLNEIVGVIDEGDSEALIKVLKKEDDSENQFLGSQVAVIFAGFRQRDSMMTVAQAAGIEALLDNM